MKSLLIVPLFLLATITHAADDMNYEDSLFVEVTKQGASLVSADKARGLAVKQAVEKCEAMIAERNLEPGASSLIAVKDLPKQGLVFFGQATIACIGIAK